MTKNASNEMGNRPGTAVQRKGRERVEAILEAAIDLLVEGGQSQFTMNQLAKRLEIRISNLQYYFPSREVLIQQLLQQFLDAALNEMNTISKTEATPEQQLNLILDYVLKDQENERSCILFSELWALANRDEIIGNAMDDFYKSYCNQVSKLLRSINPEIPTRKMNRISALVVAMIEGLSLMRGHGKRRGANLRGIEKELRDSISIMITSY